MANDNVALTLALGAGAGFGLWALLRDDEKARPTDGSTAPAPPAAPPPAALPPCALRLDAKGLTSDGTAIDIPAAVEKCRAAGRADLVIADDAPSTVSADLAVAFNAAGILINQRRNARRPRGRGRRRGRGSDLTTLAALAARMHAAMPRRQGTKRQEAAAKLARFVAAHAGAKVDETATIDFEDNVVVSGHAREMRKVAAWIDRLARDSGRAVSAVVETFNDPDDPHWAICRIGGLGLGGA